MQALPLWFILQARQGEIEDAVEKDNNQNQHVAIIASLVNCDDKAEALHDKGEDEEAGDHRCECGSPHATRLEQEIAHVVIPANP